MIAANSRDFDPTASAVDQPAVDLRLRIETPENVVLTYTLAGPMYRAGSYLLDFAIRFVILSSLGMVLACTGFFTPNFAIGMMLILDFLSSWFYYSLFEAYWSGRTPGKYLAGLRVVKDQGYPITFLASFGRNLARAVDSLGFYTVGFVTMLLSRRFQRLGDLLAGTVVVRERSVRLPREPVILERIEPLLRGELSGVPPTPRTFALIDEFLGRRNSVSITRGHEIARPLAMALARQLNFAGEWSYVEQYPMAFLARVYVTFLGRDDADAATRAPAPGPRKSASPTGPSLFE